MNMLKIPARALLVCLLFIFPLFLHAQDGAYGSYTPYSIFGIGDIRKEGTAFNSSMGGVGIATRNKRFINYLNPASVTARDSLSFMADVGLSQKNTIYRQGGLRSGNNTFNMYDFIISFPIYRSSAFIVGLTPFSDVGYNFSTKVTDPDIIGNTNVISYSASGNGSVYQLFAGGGATFWKKLSVGAQVIYYFGTLDKQFNQSFTDASYNSAQGVSNLLIRSTTAKLGVQYEQRLGEDMSMIFGATYRFRSGIRGESENYETLGTASDTLSYSYSDNSGISIADELGVGVSFKKGDRWSVEVNYLRSGWDKSGMDNTPGFAVDSDVKFSGVRKATAKGMTKSLSTMAQLTNCHSFDATAILALRKQLKANAEAMGMPNITLNDMILFAVSRVIKNHPDLNATMPEENVLRKYTHVNLGMAVDTPKGLFVPTIFHADEMSLAEISVEAKRVAKLCQEGKATPDLLAGATFTVSNVGSLGVEMFTPIINPPQVGILGVCGTITRIKEVNGEIKPYQAMPLCLTYDHRAVDGSPASRFMKELCSALENFPLLMMK